MERNPYTRQAALVRQAAQAASRTAADRSRGAVDDRSAPQAGANDPTSGDFKTFGLLDWTQFGEGFRLA
jgi:hypothetical protein